MFQFVGLGIVFYYIFRDPLPHSNSVPWIAKSERLPLFFGTAIFAIEGISVVLPIENQMRKPKEMLGWNGVLNTSMALVTALYVAMGFYGYLKYGETIESSITLNLPTADMYVNWFSFHCAPETFKMRSQGSQYKNLFATQLCLKSILAKLEYENCHWYLRNGSNLLKLKFRISKSAKNDIFDRV